MVNKSFKRNTKRRGNKVNKSRRRNIRTGMTKRTKRRNTKKRLSRKSSKRRVMRGGMFARGDEMGGTRPVAEISPPELESGSNGPIANLGWRLRPSVSGVQTPKSIAASVSSEEEESLSINTTSYNGLGAQSPIWALEYLPVRPSPRAFVHVIPLPAGVVGGLRYGELLLRKTTETSPNLILRYQKGGLSSIVARRFQQARTALGIAVDEDKVRYIFIKGKMRGHDNLYVGEEIDISNNTPKGTNKQLTITPAIPNESGGKVLQDLLNSLPEFHSE